MVPSLHTISNSIGQVLFQGADIRGLYNQSTTAVGAQEAGFVETSYVVTVELLRTGEVSLTIIK